MKFWRIALYEYKRHVLQKRFIPVLLSVPLLIALMIGLGFLIYAMENDPSPVGYVDLAGLLADPLQSSRRAGSPDDPGAPEPVELVPFGTEEEARAALEAGEIQAYYVVTADYFETNQVELVYLKKMGDNAASTFWDLMQINQLNDLPPEIARRAVVGSNLIVRTPPSMPGGGREFSEATFFSSFLPLLITIGFIILVMSSASYLVQAVVEEKENRTVEILVTSVSSDQLMGGKAVGIMGVSLTQLIAWIVFTVLGIIISGDVMGLTLLQNVHVDLRVTAVVMAVAVPTYVMVAGLMIALGATVSEGQESQQLASLFVLPMMIPIWFLAVILEHPDSPLTIVLSILPMTSISALSARLSFMSVPSWQPAVGIALAFLCAAGSLWLAGRAFRLGMLRYGQRINLREIFRPARSR